VLTHAAPDDEGDSSIEFISGGIHAAIIEALEAAAGKNVMVIGTDVARQCVQEKWKRNSHASSACFVWGRYVVFQLARRAGRDLSGDDGRHAVGQLTNLKFRVIK
jgi:hypothetical protein